MSKSLHSIRAHSGVMRRLKVLSARTGAPIGEVLRRLLFLYSTSTTEQLTMCELLDTEELGELIPNCETEAQYIERLRSESNSGDADQ
jgi:hypothetical protein